MEFKTYIGSSLEELAPQIQSELGPDAVIISQREHVTGGVGGFFAKKSIEVLAADQMPDTPTAAGPAVADAPPAGDLLLEETFNLSVPERPDSGTWMEIELPRIDVPAASPAAPAPQPAPQPVTGPVSDEEPNFVAQLRSSLLAPVQADTTDARLHGYVELLCAAGVSPQTATDLVRSALIDRRGFGADDLCSALRRRVAVLLPLAASRVGCGTQQRIGVVGRRGTGKSSAVATLARGYEAAGLEVAVIRLGRASAVVAHDPHVEHALGNCTTLRPRTVESAAQLRKALAELSTLDVLVFDLPALEGATETARARALDLLALAELDELHVAIPLNLNPAELVAMREELMTLGVDRILVTHADTALLAGQIIELVQASGLPLSFVGSGAMPHHLLRVAAPELIASQIVRVAEPRLG